MPTYNPLGLSIYLSTFEKVKDQLSVVKDGESLAFTSLHIAEEIDEEYIQRITEMLSFLRQRGYGIIADVSRRSLNAFGVETLEELKEKLDLDILRIDYGFSEKEISDFAKRNPVGINASLITDTNISNLTEDKREIYAMHNFYPRPETGLDEEQFKELNNMLRKEKIKTLAFIPGDIIKRGPIHEGLPTLESHRNISPYAAFVDLYNKYGVDYIFVGDGIINKEEQSYIELFLREKIFTIPVILNVSSETLNNMTYTIRGDSPKAMLRLQESREYATFGEHIEPSNCYVRTRGTITIDNYLYKRYSGEIQILRKDLPKDDRVNVIGYIPERYHLLLENIPNYGKIIIKDISD